MKLKLFILSVFASIIPLFSCKKEKIDGFVKYTIKRGNHNSNPLATKVFFNKCNINESAYFTSASVYNLNGSDQLDWNKLGGFKLDYNSVPKNAAMIVWRYNIVSGLFEIAPYFNNDAIIFPEINEIISVNDSEIFSYNISLDKDKATVNITKGNLSISKTRTLRNAYVFTSVSAWFGGNKTAPNDINLFIKR